MLRWVILVVAVVFLTAAATLVVQYLPDSEDASKVSVAEVTGPQPKIVVEGDLVYDFGKMAKHDKASHTWVVKNAGEVPLEVWQEGKTTCSCTAAKLDHGEKTVFDPDGQKTKMVLEPGQSKTIELEWHTEKDLGEDYSQGATFGTNDPRKKTVSLSIKGKVYAPVVIFPQMIQFPRISNETKHIAKFAVFSQERPGLKVTKVTSSRPDYVVAEAKPMTAAETKQLKVAKGYMVSVEVKSGMPLGIFHDELVVHTDHPKQPEVKLSIGGNVFGPISVTPPNLRMRDVVSRKGASRDMTLVVRGGKETHFEVAQKPEKVEISIAREDTATLKGRYRMTVSVPPGTTAGEVEGDIVLKTDHPTVSELKIHVSILISRSGSG